jgi:hypothetical protein
MAGRRPQTTRANPAPADPVAQADPAQADPAPVAQAGRRPQTTRANPAPAGPADPAPQVDPVARADQTTQVDPVGQADQTTQVDPADQADPVVPWTTALAGRRPEHGMGIPNVATSTGPRGETDRHPGDGVRRRRRRGADRSRRPGGSGSVAQSTTGATRKRPCGIPGSASGASGSSGSGSRCKRPAHTPPASPVDEAGGVLQKYNRTAIILW